MGEPIFSEEWKDATQNLPTIWASNFASLPGGRAPFHVPLPPQERCLRLLSSPDMCKSGLRLRGSLGRDRTTKGTALGLNDV